MDTLVQDIISALALGSLYAIYALPIALLFGVMRLINFAHGELIMVAGFALYLSRDLGLASILVALVACVVVALMTERVAFRPLRDANASTLLISSFAASFVLQNLAFVIFGSLPKTFSIADWMLESVSIWGIDVSWLVILTIASALVWFVLLALFLERTTLGIKMRAAAEDFNMARMCGIPANLVIAIAFSITAALAVTGAFFLTMRSGAVSPSIGIEPVVLGFVATVIGGLGSLRGAIAGAYLLGGLTVLFQVMLSGTILDFRDALVYGVVFLVLVLRPEGILGTATPEGRA